jgi:hypothetical protein
MLKQRLAKATAVLERLERQAVSLDRLDAIANKGSRLLDAGKAGLQQEVPKLPERAQLKERRRRGGDAGVDRPALSQGSAHLTEIVADPLGALRAFTHAVGAGNAQIGHHFCLRAAHPHGFYGADAHTTVTVSALCMIRAYNAHVYLASVVSGSITSWNRSSTVSGTTWRYTVSPTLITRTRSAGFLKTLRKCPSIRTSVASLSGVITFAPWTTTAGG